MIALKILFIGFLFFLLALIIHKLTKEKVNSKENVDSDKRKNTLIITGVFLSVFIGIVSAYWINQSLDELENEAHAKNEIIVAEVVETLENHLVEEVSEKYLMIFPWKALGDYSVYKVHYKDKSCVMKVENEEVIYYSEM